MVERTFELPDLGEGIAEGELVSWLVEAGDTVEEDQVIAEVETDKALVEIPSRYDGVVTELHYDEGEVVPVDATFVTFEVDEGEGGAAAEAAEAESGAETGATGAAEPAQDAGSEAADTAAADTAAAEAEERDASAETASDATAEGPSARGASVPSGRVFAAPSTRSLARELGVDIGRVEGTGPGGRVTASDVRAYAEGEEGPTSAAGSAGAGQTEAGGTSTSAAGATDGVAADEAGETDEEPVAVGGERADRERTLAMPATRKLAEELGVDLNAVPASEEREGEPFVTPEDVRRFAERGEQAEAAAAEATTTATPAAGAEADAAASAAEATGSSADVAGAGGETDRSDRPGERVPYRGVRRTIGEQMAKSKYTAPHVSHHDEFDATDLVSLREELDAAAGDDVKLTYLPFVVKAITAALKEFPYLNASLDEEAEEIVLHDEYNIGIAVATDAGLMVPVVDDADEKGLKQLAREIDDLATRARNRKIKPEEMQGGTFTVTNIGVIGGEFSSPIINHPEAAIFAVGPIKKRPWVVDDEVVARTTMRFSMSVDHRLVDGADAAQFSNRVKELLSAPARLLLE